MAKREYKPLLFTTTVRNPQRFKDLLNVLLIYNGKILTNDLIYSVVFDLISKKMYLPVYINHVPRLKEQLPDEDMPFSKEDTEEIIKNSPQDHKEAGFEKGWASRFDTWYKMAKELGFVYYKMNEPIEISEMGLMLIKSIENDYAYLENQVFLNAFVKYERDNPFRRVLNRNKPLILLLQTIKELKRIYGDESAGMLRLEIPLLLCWHDEDYKALAVLIQHLRAEYKFSVSEDVIYDKCKILLDTDTKPKDKRFKKDTVIHEMPDEFIRKMRLTGLISIRGNGRFIDINNVETNKINYCLDVYSSASVEYKTECEYFNYMKKMDANLVSIEAALITDISEREKKFKKWVDEFSLDIIKQELLIVCNPRESCRNEILKYISGPIRFEFLTALALAKAFPELKVQANYVIDDEGLPTSFAPGGCADIVCYDDLGNILFEVTLLTGTQQNTREVLAIRRHLEEKMKTAPDSFSVLICPRAHIDTINHSKWLRESEKIKIYVLETHEFTASLGVLKNARLYSKQ